MVFIPHVPGKLLKLYIAIKEELIEFLQTQDVNDKTARVVYYLSQILNDDETRYMRNHVYFYITPISNLNIIYFPKIYWCVVK